MQKILLAVLALGYSHFSFADCTPRPGQATADFAQVMYHFGRGTRIGGTLARKGIEGSAVSQEMVQEAIDALAVARECLGLSRDAVDPELLPRKASTLSGPEREQYLLKFQGHMDNFGSALDEFKAMFCQALLALPDKTGFQMMRDQEQLLMDLANEAHEDLK